MNGGIKHLPVFNVSRGIGHDHKMEDFHDWEQQVKTERIMIPIGIENRELYIKDIECPICSNLLMEP